jgi:hypothetical protein
MCSKRWMWVIVVGWLVIGGCEKKEEAKVPTTGPVSPAAAVEEPRVTSTPEIKETRGLPESALRAVDDKDDPKYALLFPGSEKIGGWIKTVPVTGGAFQKKLSDFLPQLDTVLAPFAGESISTVTYERMVAGKVETVKVYLIRAATGDDAYGMMSVSCPGADVLGRGEVRRSEKPEEIFVAKGPYFGIFSGKTAGEDMKSLAEGVELLAGKVLFELPDHAEPPMIVQVFQTERLPSGTVLFLRNLQGLKGPAGKSILEAIGATDVERLNKLLKLGPKVEFAVAAFTNKDWPGPDVIWIAKYPTREQAIEVGRQYHKALNRVKSADKLDSNTLLKGPSGRFLLGTWTMETESATQPHLMNLVQSFLPGGK